MIVAYQPDEFFNAMEATRERRYGPLPELNVTEDFSLGERPGGTPMGIKTCANCGSPSLRKMSLDGRNYYCPKTECKQARDRFNKMKRVLQ